MSSVGWLIMRAIPSDGFLPSATNPTMPTGVFPFKL